ncbi:MAG: hypothetical protein PHY48_08170 [Candidatus Cloacimonetes bacterium]|nr:hypothetical protein [Candidatus Cloacimonadota bacterium]
MKTFLNIGLMLLIALFLVSCGKQNPFAPAAQQTQEEISFSDQTIPLADGEFIYRQGIQIAPHAGSVYSYKISTLGSDLPDGIVTDEQGWIYFRVTGDESGKPLTETGTHRNIWTTQTLLSCDFISQEGKLTNLITKVELRERNKAGNIIELSSAFRSDRLISSRIVIPFFNNGVTTGTGMEFGLQENIGNIYVEGLYAHHFMYRLNILDGNQQVLSHGDWYSSLESQDMRKVALNATTTPAIIPNAANQFTQFESYVVSRQGVEEASRNTVYFKAASGNKPTALIYSETLVGLGQYHYTIDVNSHPQAYYEQISTSNENKNRALWLNDTGYEAINSQDFKLHLRWGHKGLYDSDNPMSILTNDCYNESGVSYYSKVVAYDLRLDGAPFPTFSQFFEPVVVSHGDGSSWLRIKNMFDSCRHVLLSNLSNANHTFEVCAVDLQNVYSLPAQVIINLLPYKPVSQRNGILIVDDSKSNINYSPEQTVDSFYNAVMPSHWGEVSVFDTYSSTDQIIGISTPRLQNYQAVIWHSDNPATVGTLSNNIDPLDMYLANGGKLIVSGTNKLLSAFQELNFKAPNFLSNRLGIPNTTSYGQVGLSITNNPFFIQADGLNGLSDVNLNTTTSFNSIVNLRKGLGTIAYFNPDAGLNFIYKLGCKAVDFPTYPPTQEQYALYSSKYVGYKYSHLGSEVVVLGFPLSYMVQAEVSSALQSILGEMLGTNLAKGGSK